MTNLLEQAISCGDGDQAAKIIQQALGIESDDVLNYTFPKDWPTDREVRARIIGGWLPGGGANFGRTPKDEKARAAAAGRRSNPERVYLPRPRSLHRRGVSVF